MKRVILLSLLGVLLGGCVVLPAGYVSYGDGYHHRSYGYYGYGYRGYYGGYYRYPEHGQ
jgi:hypothetical protein